MFFALGFLLASLCALLLLPTINARAVRLTRRRMDALLPRSVGEIAAERDALRADFAVTQRRLERRVEAALSQRHADMAASGARALEIAALARRIVEREAMLATSRAEFEAATTRIAGLDRDLADSSARGETSDATLRALEDAYRAILDEHKAARREREVAADTDHPDALDRTRQDDALRRECEALRTRLHDAETAATHRDVGDEGELRRRIAEVADALAARDRLPVAKPFLASTVAHG